MNAGDDLPKVPNQVWEKRVSQLEDLQHQQFSRGAFMRGDAGVMTGKENSHEPKASMVTIDGKAKVEVVVNHVMGKNGLDAGASDAGAPDAAKPDAAADAGKADAGDAGNPDGGTADAGLPIVHYITTIWLRGLVNGADTVVALWEFESTDAAPPTVDFTLPAGVTSVTAYEWCTLHGLWTAPALAI